MAKTSYKYILVSAHGLSREYLRNGEELKEWDAARSDPGSGEGMTVLGGLLAEGWKPISEAPFINATGGRRGKSSSRAFVLVTLVKDERT